MIKKGFDEDYNPEGDGVTAYRFQFDAKQTEKKRKIVENPGSQVVELLNESMDNVKKKHSSDNDKIAVVVNEDSRKKIKKSNASRAKK